VNRSAQRSQTLERWVIPSARPFARAPIGVPGRSLERSGRALCRQPLRDTPATQHRARLWISGGRPQRRGLKIVIATGDVSVTREMEREPR